MSSTFMFKAQVILIAGTCCHHCMRMSFCFSPGFGLDTELENHLYLTSVQSGYNGPHSLQQTDVV